MPGGQITFANLLFSPGIPIFDAVIQGMGIWFRRFVAFAMALVILGVFVVRTIHILRDHHHCHHADEKHAPVHEEDDCALCEWALAPFVAADITEIDIASPEFSGFFQSNSESVFISRFFARNLTRGPPVSGLY